MVLRLVLLRIVLEDGKDTPVTKPLPPSEEGEFNDKGKLDHLARKGQRVVQWQVIGEVGSTGRVTGPHLHLEIRRNNVARDPLYYLP